MNWKGTLELSTAPGGLQQGKLRAKELQKAMAEDDGEE